MTVNFQHISIKNLGLAQQQVLNAIREQEIDITKDSWHWIENTNSFLDLPTIRELINELGVDDLIHQINIGVTLNKKSIIHIDDGKFGDFDYSLNIPILNTDNTFINFYRPLSDMPQNGTWASKGEYKLKAFEEHEVELIERVETNKVGYVNTKVPHSFESFNGTPRVMLCLRLDNNFSLDK